MSARLCMHLPALAHFGCMFVHTGLLLARVGKQPLGADLRSPPGVCAHVCVCRYVDIIKANNMLLGAKKSGQTDIKIQAAEEMLQYHVATLIDNQLPNQPQASQRGGRPLKTIRERLVGKVCVVFLTHAGVDALAVACCAVPCVSYCGQ